MRIRWNASARTVALWEDWTTAQTLGSHRLPQDGFAQGRAEAHYEMSSHMVNQVDAVDLDGLRWPG